MIKHHTGFFVSVWHDADETPHRFIMFSTCARCGVQVKPEGDGDTLQEAMIRHHMDCFITDQKQEQKCELD